MPAYQRSTSGLASAEVDKFLNVLSTRLDRLQFYEDFLQRPQLNAVMDPGASFSQTALTALVKANRNFEVAGTNMTSALATFADGGGVTLTDAGAASDAAVLQPHQDTNMSGWLATKFNTEDEIAIGTKIKTGAAITTVTFQFGFGLSLVDATDFTVGNDADAIWVRYNPSDGSGYFQMIQSVNNTDTSFTTDVLVVAATQYILEIAVDDDRVPRMFIDGVLKATGTALKADTDLVIRGGHLDTGGTARAITYRNMAVSKTHND